MTAIIAGKFSLMLVLSGSLFSRGACFCRYCSLLGYNLEMWNRFNVVRLALFAAQSENNSSIWQCR